MKAVRTDRELECPEIDAGLRARGVDLVTLPDGISEQAVIDRLSSLPADALTTGDDGDELWGLVLEASRLDEVVDAAVRSLEISLVAKFAFGLAQAFNAFYHRQQILREEREDARVWRAAGVIYFKRQLTRALDLMGCAVPARM